MISFASTRCISRSCTWYATGAAAAVVAAVFDSPPNVFCRSKCTARILYPHFWQLTNCSVWFMTGMQQHIFCRRCVSIRSRWPSHLAQGLTDKSRILLVSSDDPKMKTIVCSFSSIGTIDTGHSVDSVGGCYLLLYLPGRPRTGTNRILSRMKHLLSCRLRVYVQVLIDYTFSVPGLGQTSLRILYYGYR